MFWRPALLCLAALAMSCSADPNEQANNLFVAAQQMIERAPKEGSDARVRLLEAGEQSLKAIVTSYPASNLAVQLSSGQSIGTVSFKLVSALLRDARWAPCVENPKARCVLVEALEQASSISDEVFRAIAMGAVAQAQVKAGLLKEAASTLDRTASLPF